MTSWEELRNSGISGARGALAKLKDERGMLAAFAAWWKERQTSSNAGPVRLHLHPSTLHLAGELCAAGLDAAADFAVTQWVAEGPIHPGVWSFSILLGESFVAEFIDRLIDASWQSPRFYGLENFGAWDAFESLLRRRLTMDTGVTAAVTERLRLLVVQAAVSLTGDGKPDQIALRRVAALSKIAIAKFAGTAFAEGVHAVSDALRCFPAVTGAGCTHTQVKTGSGAKAAKNPRFKWVNTVLGNIKAAMVGTYRAVRAKHVPRYLAEFEYRFNRRYRLETMIGRLAYVSLRTAPMPYGLLKLADVYAQSGTAMDADGSIRVAPVDKPELLAPAIERCEATMKMLLDALFVRADAIPLAWEWLDRLVCGGKLRGRWPVGDGSRALAVNMPMLLIAALAGHLSWRSDWQEWIGKRERLWRVYRTMAVFAAGTFGEEAGKEGKERLAEALEQVLINGDLEYAGIADAMTDSLDIVAALGGRAVCVLDDPGGWFEAAWDKLRPIREQNWRMGQGSGKRHSSGELLALWGFAAYEFLPEDPRPRLWASLEKAVRDAWQTDSFIYAPAWTKALLRLFSYFPADKSGGKPPAEQMAQALLPYIAADYRFLALATSLVEHGWPVDGLREAVELTGFDLKRLVQQFLAMKELVLRLRQSNPEEIGRFRALARALD
jgi:hypothetical protein